MAEKKRAYCKNTVQGRQRGPEVPAQVPGRGGNGHADHKLHLCGGAAVRGAGEHHPHLGGRRGKRGDVWAEERRAAAREIALRASLGTRAQVSYLQSRVEENRRAAQVSQKLHARLDEAARARDFSIGTLLKSEDEALADAAEVGLVVYASQGSYDRQLDPEEEKLLNRQLERYEGRTMTDKDAANMTKVLMTVAERAAAMLPGDNGLGEKNSPRWWRSGRKEMPTKRKSWWKFRALVRQEPLRR